MVSNGLTPAPETGPSAAGPNEEADATSLESLEAQRQLGDTVAQVQMTVVSQAELTRATITNQSELIRAHITNENNRGIEHITSETNRRIEHITSESNRRIEHITDESNRRIEHITSETNRGIEHTTNEANRIFAYMQRMEERLTAQIEQNANNAAHVRGLRLEALEARVDHLFEALVDHLRLANSQCSVCFLNHSLLRLFCSAETSTGGGDSDEAEKSKVVPKMG